MEMTVDVRAQAYSWKRVADKLGAAQAWDEFYAILLQYLICNPNH